MQLRRSPRPPRRLAQAGPRSASLVLCLVLAASCGITVAPPPSPTPGVPGQASPSATSGIGPTGSPGVPGASSSPSAPAPTDGLPGPTSSPLPSPTPTPTVPLVFFPPSITPEMGAAMQAEVDRLRLVMELPAVSIAVRLPSGETWKGVSGLASVDPEEPADEDTVFAIASITKTFVAALILSLVEDGVLTLGDRLSRFVPDFERADRITIRQLLSHTSGTHDYFSSERYRRAVFTDRSRVFTVDEILDLVLSPRCQPGSCHSYSNTNYVLLGRVAEIATGRPIAALLRDRFLEPLGLERTVFQPDHPTPRNAAHGHLFQGNTLVDFTGNHRIIPHPSGTTVAWAAGGMASTPSELTAWADALYGARVLEPASVARMTDFSRGYGVYGLGTRTFTFHGRQAVGHTGGIHGFVSVMAYFPDEGVSMAVTQNRGLTSPFRVLKRVMAVLTGLRSVPPQPTAPPG